jgi:hypothetical protein
MAIIRGAKRFNLLSREVVSIFSFVINFLADLDTPGDNMIRKRAPHANWVTSVYAGEPDERGL